MPLDTSETQKLIDAVNDFTVKTVAQAQLVLAKGALEMKRNLKANARTSDHFKHLAPKITYDTKVRRAGVEIELGPENDKAVGKANHGPGAGIAYFGGANGGGGSLDFDEPVEREFDSIDEYMKKLGDLL